MLFEFGEDERSKAPNSFNDMIVTAPITLQKLNISSRFNRILVYYPSEIRTRTIIAPTLNVFISEKHFFILPGVDLFKKFISIILWLN